MSFLSVGYSQTVSDTSIISMSGADWSLKVDSSLASSIDSRNTPYMTAKSSTEKELFLELASLEDCKSGVVQFKVDMAGLTAYKQLPLTQEEIDSGSFRPKNVENSFALFDSDGKKVAHIYGSKITDAKGVEVWLDQNLQDGLLTVILPKPEVLETLSFPLLLDPTFGYTSVGASNGGSANVVYGSCRTYIPVDIEVSAINYYSNTNNYTKVGIYSDNAGLPDQKQFESNITFVNTASWNTISTGEGVVLAAGYYWLALQCNGSGPYNYDTFAGTQQTSSSNVWGNSWDQTWSNTGSSARMLSIFATYTVYSSPTAAPTDEDMTNTDWWISILVLLLIIINIFLMMLPFALVRFVFGILSLFLCMLALSYAIPLSPYLQTAGLLISALAMLFSVRARE